MSNENYSNSRRNSDCQSFNSEESAFPTPPASISTGSDENERAEDLCITQCSESDDGCATDSSKTLEVATPTLEAKLSDENDATPTAASPILTEVPEIVDDSWIDDWDMKVHRCEHCNRPFVTQARLSDHRQVWHSIGSPAISSYQRSEAAPQEGPGELVVIVKGGDLFIDTKTIRFQVASQILWTNSRVFSTILGPESHFQHAWNLRRAQLFGTPAVIALNDDCAVLQKVLEVLHHRHIGDDNWHDLTKISKICAKYALCTPLKSFVDAKLREITKQAFGEPDYDESLLQYYDEEDLLLISYVFNYANIFSEASKGLILHRTSDEFEKKISRSILWSVQDAIVEKRSIYISKIRNGFEKIYAQRNIGTVLCRLKTSTVRVECSYLQSGQFANFINMKGLDKPTFFWNDALFSIATELKDVPMMRLPGDRFRRHQQCHWAVELKKIVESTMSSVEGLELAAFRSDIGGSMVE